MIKGIRARGKFDKKDVYRTLLTETLPNEVPIIFSNDGLRSNLADLALLPDDLQLLIRATITENDSDYTIPWRYQIAKGPTSSRQLSLLHPHSQLSICLFYREYQTLLTYYASRGNFSIRYPARAASAFFYSNPLANARKYKTQNIDTVYDDRLSRYPSSFFAYEGFNRYYKFFDSPDFLRLEKQFPSLELLDISKCFDSIYTHSVSWAIKDQTHGKDFKNSRSFGNSFDTLMQKMNYNETSGIAVGPEISRIFAEIILVRCDMVIDASLQKGGFKRGYHYDIRRYVDDYAVFSLTKDIGDVVRVAIYSTIRDYNLHLNEAKSERLERPFLTHKSAVTQHVIRLLDSFWRDRTEQLSENAKSMAKPVRDRSLTAKSFIRQLKAVCHERGASYADVSSLLLSAIDRRIERLVETIENIGSIDEDAIQSQLDLMMVFIEISFFVYTVHPTVSGSFKVAKSAIIAYRFTRQTSPSRTDQVSEDISRWCRDFLRADIQSFSAARSHIPVEKLNILLCVGEFGDRYASSCLEFIQRVISSDRLDYFSVISLIYAMRNRPIFLPLMSALEEKLITQKIPGLKVNRRSEDLHIALDLISCPYLSTECRDALVRRVSEDLNLNIGRDRRGKLLQEMEERPWFVQWRGIDLLNMLERKELNSVY